MYVCVCVLCVCTCACVCVCVRVHVHVCVRTCAHMDVCRYGHIYTGFVHEAYHIETVVLVRSSNVDTVLQ